MRINLSLTDVEDSSKRLKAFLQERGFDIAYAQALDLSARILGFKNCYNNQNGQRLSPLDEDLTEAELAHRDRFQMDVLEREGYGEIATELLDRVDPTGSGCHAFPEHEGFHLLRRQPRLRIAHQRSPSRQSIQHDREEGEPDVRA
jgi:hypothetical protein